MASGLAFTVTARVASKAGTLTTSSPGRLLPDLFIGRAPSQVPRPVHEETHQPGSGQA